MTNHDTKEGSNWPTIGGSRVAWLIALVIGIAVAMVLFIRYAIL